MSGRPREQIFDDYSKVEDWESDDPYGENPETYQQVFEEIRLRVAKLAQECRQHDAVGSTQASPSNQLGQIERIREQQNARLETLNAPQRGRMIPPVSTSREVTGKHGAASVLSHAAALALPRADQPATPS